MLNNLLRLSFKAIILLLIFETWNPFIFSIHLENFQVFPFLLLLLIYTFDPIISKGVWAFYINFASELGGSEKCNWENRNKAFSKQIQQRFEQYQQNLIRILIRVKDSLIWLKFGIPSSNYDDCDCVGWNHILIISCRVWIVRIIIKLENAETSGSD